MINLDKIREELFEKQDLKYKKFHTNLIPGKDKIIGVRAPMMKDIAKRIAKSDDVLAYLDVALPIDEEYYEETDIQGLVIGYIQVDAEKRLSYIKKFVPKIDNWAVCDTFCANLKFTKKNKDLVWDFIMPYLKSDKEYDLRFASVMLMDYYMDDEHVDEVLKIYDQIKHEGYYVKMAVAWGLSVCFIKYSEKTMAYFKNNDLDKETYNKTLQKMIESRRVDDETKDMLRSMKRK